MSRQAHPSTLVEIEYIANSAIPIPFDTNFKLDVCLKECRVFITTIVKNSLPPLKFLGMRLRRHEKLCDIA